MGRDLQEIKPLAEQIYRLAGELLRVIDMDEQARQKFIEDLKKTHAGKFYISPVLNQTDHKTRISKKRRTATICGNLNTATVALRNVAENEKTERKGGFIRAEFT